MPKALEAMLQAYSATLPPERNHLLHRYRIVDVVRKVVGVGSVGTSCWVILLQGEGPDDPLFLQVKEAGPSVLAEHLTRGRAVANQGERVVTGQRLIQGSPDIFLGWGKGADSRRSDFYVRQLADMKGGLDLVENDRSSVGQLRSYCALCGWALALAHAESGNAALISGYAGRGDALARAVGTFALAYADQTGQDHAALLSAIRSGRIQAMQAV